MQQQAPSGGLDAISEQASIAHREGVCGWRQKINFLDGVPGTCYPKIAKSKEITAIMGLTGLHIGGFRICHKRAALIDFNCFSYRGGYGGV
jgi:hypothetical protein